MRNVSQGPFYPQLILTVFIVFLFFSPTVWAYDYDSCSGRVEFVGNTVIDTEIRCYLGPNSTSVTARIKKNDQTIYQTSDRTASDLVEGFYRDANVAKGSTYDYSFCGIFAYAFGEREICSRYEFNHTATAGEVGGELIQDLEMSGETISLHLPFNVLPGVTLAINNSTIERGEGSGYSSISGPTYPTEQSSGGIRITNSTIQSASLIFTVGDNNLLSGNDIYGSVRIRRYAEATISDNSFFDSGVYINSANATAQILRNDFRNSFVEIGDSRGNPTVLIDNNEFIISPLEKGIIASGGNSSITNNTFSGQIDLENDWYAVSGIEVNRSSTTPIPIEAVISDNLFSGFSTALWLSTDADVTASGNIFRDNKVGCTVAGTAAAILTDNSFYENTEGIDFRGGSLTLNNNCIAGNSSRGFSHSYYYPVMVDATNNWWGAVSGPKSYYGNPEGAGDDLYIRNAGTVSFSPWLTESICETIPVPEPATLTISVDSSDLPADGSSTAILTITLTDENSLPIANAALELGTPATGSLASLSGTTNVAGQLLVEYQAPIAEALSGQDFVELNVQYPAESISASAVINFTFTSLSVWADPHIDSSSSDVAVIPGDSRFPGRYQFTLRDFSGQPYSGETLTVSIADSTIARLEGSNGQIGREITITTDEEGRATVDYIYLGIPDFSAPREDTIFIAHDSLSSPMEAKVSIGLDINIIDLIPVERDTGSFPKTLGMRINLEDYYRPNMDVRAYLSALENVSGHTVGMEVSVEWPNRPVPEIMDNFQAIFPNYGNDDPPELYDGLTAINYGDNNQTEIIVEALDTPNIAFGNNTFPAITFTDPGKFWFVAYAEPVILSQSSETNSEYIKGARQDKDMGMIFGASILPEGESIFQSVVCSLKPTGTGQFLAMRLLLNNPYFDAIPIIAAPVAVTKLMVKTSGAICDFMQGNYVTAAGNLASLRIDILKNAHGTGEAALDLADLDYDQYLRLMRLIKINDFASKWDDVSNYIKYYVNPALTSRTTTAARSVSSPTAALQSQLFGGTSLPEDLSMAEYQDVVDKTLSGQLGSYTDLTGWQALGVINDGSISLTNLPGETEFISFDNVHTFLLPPSPNTLDIVTTSDVQIFRHYRASDQEVLGANYSFLAAEGNTSHLSLDVLDVNLKIDHGADGTIDETISPQLNREEIIRTDLTLYTNQTTYQPGDTLIVSVGLINPGESILADVYFSIKNSSGLHISIPDLSPGYTPMFTNLTFPAALEISETPFFSFPVTESLSGAGEFTIEALLTHPGTMDVIGGNIDRSIIRFP